MVIQLPVHMILLLEELSGYLGQPLSDITFHTRGASADRWHSWTVTRLQNGRASGYTLILTPKASLHGGSCEPPRLCSTRTEWVLFRPGTAAWGPASCDLFTPHPSLRPSFCQQKKCKAMTLRLSGLFYSRSPCNQRERRLDSLALRPRRAVQKYLPQQRGCAVLSWPFHSSLSSASSPSMASLLHLSVVQLFTFFSTPGDPISEPWADLSAWRV